MQHELERVTRKRVMRKSDYTSGIIKIIMMEVWNPIPMSIVMIMIMSRNVTSPRGMPPLSNVLPFW
jgi:hypothetical protein